MNLSRVFAGALAVCAFAGSVEAQLAVDPQRVVFEGPRRSAAVTVVNRSGEEATYRVRWKARQMDPDGRVVRLGEGEAPEVEPAGGMIRYAPRRFTLPPGGSQKVRMLLRRPEGAETGERRSHLAVLAEPEARSTRSGSGMSVSVDVAYGVTIPVIVRTGDPKARVAISGPEIRRDNGDARLAFSLDRDGDRSVHGDVVVEVGGERVAWVRGISVYTEIDSRRMSVDLDGAPDLAGRSVTVTYRADDGETTLAERTFEARD